MRCRLLLLVFASFLVAPLTTRAQGRRARRDAEPGAGPTDLIPKWSREIESKPRSIATILDRYDRVEASGRYSAAWTSELHGALLGALRKVEHSTLERTATRVLGRSIRGHYPSIVLMMKAVIGERFPVPRARRVEWLVEKATGSHFRLSIWGLRMLGASRWPEAVDAMVGILEREEAGGRVDGVLHQTTALELYHVLGAPAAVGTAGAIRTRWEAMGKKLPDEPDYSLDQADGGADGEHATVAFFGDRISPRSVFLIDTSSSMRQSATIGSSGSGGSRPKVEVVKEELARSLGGLRKGCEFNVLSYNSTWTAWKKGPRGVELVEATASSVESSRRFALGLATDTGTNIHDSLETALLVPEVETIYLLSDGEPSRGGGKEKIEATAGARNYLTGVRIVSYGIVPEGKGSFDEKFMRRLSRTHWGWYRRLNR